MNYKAIFKWVIGIIGIILFFVSLIYLLTRPFILAIADFENSIPIAEVLNGITAPIIGVIGALLVYYSFLEQVKANRELLRSIKEERELSLLYKFYEELKEDLIRIQSIYAVKYGEKNVLDSLMNYVIDDKSAGSPYPELEHYLKYIFNQFIFMSKRLKRSNSLSVSESVYLMDKVIYLFQLYFEEYHRKITSKLFENNWIVEFKKSFEELHFELSQLSHRREVLKQELRDNSSY